MSTETVPKVETPDRAGQVARISGGYFLRLLVLLAESHAGDMTRAIIFFAIASANTSHLDARGFGDAYVSANTAPPDEERRPLNVMSLSQMLGMPFETARRHVNKLIAEGKCRRVRGGVIVPQAVVETEAMQQLAAVNYQNVRRLMRDLRRAGVDFD